MNELVFCTGILLAVIGIVFWTIVVSLSEMRKIIIAKLDAIMAKLIEIKPR